MKVSYINIAKQQETIKDELLAAIDKVLSCGNFILGEEVRQLETSFADYCQTRYAAGVNSGTDALVLALRATGIGIGDEVITVSHSFVATGASIVLAGALPIFIDVDWDQNMNPELIENAITKKTKAIMPVHLTGKPAKMDLICNIAKKHKLIVIEDAAPAVGAEYLGRRVGSWGDLGCFSFSPLKNLNACGDGGIVVTQNEEYAKKIKIMRNIGLRDRDNCVILAGNSRLDEMQAAILNVKLKYLEEVIEKRRMNAKRYIENLREVVKVPLDTVKGRDVYHMFIIQSDRRDELKNYLFKNNIDCKIHYPKPIHHQGPFKKYVVNTRLPVTDKMVSNNLSLPVDHSLSLDEIDYVSQKIVDFF